MSTTIEQIALLLNRQKYEAWLDVSIGLSLDGFSQVEFNAPFEPDRLEFRETFKPFSYLPAELSVDNDRLFTGVMLSPHPDVSKEERTVGVTAYSKPAIIADCTPPVASIPAEYRKMNLRQIAESVLRPFGISVTAESVGSTFDEVGFEPQQTIGDFLFELARQRGLVVTDTPEGNLSFIRSARPGNPVARLKEGEAPLGKVTPAFSVQGYYSEITCFARTKAGRPGSRYTAQNPRLQNVLRPINFVLPDVKGGELPAATVAKTARMFGNMVTYAVELPTWRDPRGVLWTPNTTISLQSESAMIYRPTEFLIRGVTLFENKEETSAELEVVLPGAFSGEFPEVLPWD